MSDTAYIHKVHDAPLDELKGRHEVLLSQYRENLKTAQEADEIAKEARSAAMEIGMYANGYAKIIESVGGGFVHMIPESEG